MAIISEAFESLNRTIAELSSQLAESTAEGINLTLELAAAHAEIEILRSKIVNPPPALSVSLSGKSKAVELLPSGKRTIRKPASVRTEEDLKAHGGYTPKVPAGYRKLAKNESMAGSYWFDPTNNKWRDYNSSPTAHASFNIVEKFGGDIRSESSTCVAIAPKPLNGKDGTVGYEWVPTKICPPMTKMPESGWVCM